MATQTTKEQQVVMYLKPLRTGEEQLVDWPLHKHLADEPGMRLAHPGDFKIGDRVMYEHTTEVDFEQETGAVLAINAMVVRLSDGRLAAIEWDSGHLTYIG